MKQRFLFIGDIHLGRRPLRLPDDLTEYGVDPAQLTPATAWRLAVRWAVSNNIDAVVLAGDVIEGMDDRFEALALLERGIRTLVDTGIPVFGIAGNHDVEALPLVAARIDGFRLVGEGGRWETADLGGESGARLLGWSHHEKRHETDPTESLVNFVPDKTRATIAVLHADLDDSRSNYAPVSRAGLESIPTDAWFLGHIHTPSDLSGSRPIGYLGSLVGLDPGEPGRRGPWLVTVGGPGEVEAEQIPLAPIRWERLDVSVEEMSTDEGQPIDDRFHQLLYSALETIRDRIDGGTELLAVGCRLRLTGKNEDHLLIGQLVREGIDFPRLTADRTHYFVEKIIDESTAPFDLEKIAAGSDPPAILAGKILALQGRGVEGENILRDATNALAPVSGAARWQGVDTQADDPATVREILVRAGLEVLEKLMAQQAPPASADSSATLTRSEGES